MIQGDEVVAAAVPDPVRVCWGQVLRPGCPCEGAQHAQGISPAQSISSCQTRQVALPVPVIVLKTPERGAICQVNAPVNLQATVGRHILLGTRKAKVAGLQMHSGGQNVTGPSSDFRMVIALLVIPSWSLKHPQPWTHLPPWGAPE